MAKNAAIFAAVAVVGLMPFSSWAEGACPASLSLQLDEGILHYHRTLVSCGDVQLISVKILDPNESCVWGDCSGSRECSMVSGTCDYQEDIPVGCWAEGTYRFLYTTGCHVFIEGGCLITSAEPGNTIEKSFRVDHTTTLPQLQATRTQTGANTYRIAVTYDYPGTPALGSRSVTARWLPSKPSRNGETGFPGSPITISPDPAPLAKSGAFSFDVEAQQKQEMIEIEGTGACGQRDVAQVSIPEWKCCCDGGPPCAGDPVRLSSGNMRYSEDERLPGSEAARLVRTYDSSYAEKGLFGKGWVSVLDSWLRLTTAASGTHTVVIATGENDRLVFSDATGTYVQTFPVTERAGGQLVVNASTAVYTDRNARTASTFRLSDGALLSRRSLATGRELTITWDSNILPTRADDSWGAFAWVFTTDQTAHSITNVTVEGTAISRTYGYTGDLLTGVNVTGATAWRTYEYTSGRLSAIRDAQGNLLESHSYAANGAASDSQGPAGEITSVTYGLTGRTADETITRVGWASGRQVDHYIRPIAGDSRTVEVAGGCSSCTGENAVFGYDRFGNLVRKQDARGYVSEMAYDSSGRLIGQTDFQRPADCDPASSPTQCHLTPDTILTTALVTTPATITRTYSYGDPNWPTRPDQITMTSVHAPTPGSTWFRAFDFDAATGETTADAPVPWLGLPPYVYIDALTTFTALYDGSEGAAFNPCGTGSCGFASSWLTLPQPHLRKSADGPRTDVPDVTKYVYYPIDPAVPATWRGQLAAVRDSVGLVTRFENYDVFGHAGRTIDPNGIVTEQGFDSLGRLLTSTVKAGAGCNTAVDPTCATDLVIINVYFPGGGLLQTTTRPGGGVTTYDYDARTRIQSITRTVAPGIDERIVYDYDSSGRKSGEHYLAGTGGAFMEKRSETFLYDAQDRLTETHHADGTRIVYSYDVAGNAASIQDESHTAPNTFYSYDPAGRLATATQTLGTGQITTTYDYDAHGNLTKVIDPNGNTTTYVYDDVGRMLQQTSPVTGVTTYVYDKGGNLVSTTDANGATTTRTYDEASRLLTAISTRGASSEGVSWTYDDTTIGNHGQGRLRSMTDPAGTTLYAYERRGMVRVEIRQPAGVADPYVTLYAYDADGNRSSIRYPSGMIATYGFDQIGRPTSVSTSSTSVITAASYLPFGPVSNLTFGNSFRQDFLYDGRYRMTDEWVTRSGGYRSYHHYVYDDPGKTMAIQDWTLAAYNRSFAFDDLGRLVSSTSGSALWGSAQYQYDAMGNMLLQSVGTRQTAFTYSGATPKLLGVTENGTFQAVTYDAAGNETGNKVDRTYSPRNLMASIQQRSETDAHRVEYGYDGRGVRVRRAETGLQCLYTYSPELRLLSYTKEDASWTVTHPYANTKQDIVWLGDRPVAQITPDGSEAPFYTFADHLGTPYMQYDTFGNIRWQVDAEPYGNPWTLRAGTATAQRLRFPGQEMDNIWEGAEESYNVFRWYRSGWGRYTQVDPISPHGTGIQYDIRRVRQQWKLMPVLGDAALVTAATLFNLAVNPYPYVSGDPALRADKLGLFFTPCFLYMPAGFKSYVPQQVTKPGTKTKRRMCMLEGKCLDNPDPRKASIVDIEINEAMFLDEIYPYDKQGKGRCVACPDFCWAYMNLLTGDLVYEKCEFRGGRGPNGGDGVFPAPGFGK